MVEHVTGRRRTTGGVDLEQNGFDPVILFRQTQMGNNFLNHTG